MQTDKYKNAIAKIYQRVGETVIRDIPTLNYIMNVDSMSDTDKIFYEAYKKYGNRNQTWQDFKAMFNGDVERMHETVKNWKDWDERNRMNNQTATSKNEVKKLLHKYNLRSIGTDAPAEYEQLKKTFPDLVQSYENFLAQDDAAQPNYCTFNPQVAQLEQEFANKLKAIAPNDIKAKNRLLADYIIKMDNLVDLENGDFVIGERIETYRKIILNNKAILETLQNFDKLSGSEKVDLARMILNESAKINGIPQGTVIEDDAPNGPHVLGPNQGAGYDKFHEKFFFRGNSSSFKNLLGFLKTLAHEDAHRIDYHNANYGMIGSQMMRFVTDNYLNNADIEDYLYKKWATEQSSYYLDLTTGAALEYTVKHQRA